jgi:proline iminopeptidase
MIMKLKLISCYIFGAMVIFLNQESCFGQSTSISGTIAVDEFNLRYTIEGEGKPTLVIGSSIYYPRTFSKNLRKHLKFVFLDHRGSAPYPGKLDTVSYSLEKILQDMETARQQLNMGEIIVIGHSGHSYMALEYAKKYPENVSHVVMIGIAPNLGPENAKLTERVWEESVDPVRKKIMQENLQRLPDEKLAQLSGGQIFNQRYIRNGPHIWYDPHFDATPLFEGVEFNMDMFNYMWGSVFRDIDITKNLENLSAPVFLALGRYDNIVAPPYSWDPFRPKFHDLTVRIFEKSGHTPQLEQPEYFDEELLDWLEEKD